jgi:hypothetical protein
LPCGFVGGLDPKLSVGGYVIVDDYFLPACREAVHDYREAYDIKDEIIPIDDFSGYWRRTGYPRSAPERGWR